MFGFSLVKSSVLQDLSESIAKWHGGYCGMEHDRFEYAQFLRSIGYQVDYRGIGKDGKLLVDLNRKANGK